MSILLVQGCSKSKKPAEEPIPAMELYTGYFYKIIKKARREDECRSDVDICILSAEHGIIEPGTEIAPYDSRMNRETAVELRKEVVSNLHAKIEARGYSRVVLNLGADYRRAVTGLESRIDVPVIDIQGQLGERGQTLKRFIRGQGRVEEAV